MLLPTLAVAGLLLASITPHDPEEHIAELTAAIRRTPRAAGLYVRRAELYLQVAAPRLALADFERALALEPANGSAVLGAADVHYRLGDDAAALDCLGRAAALGAPPLPMQRLRGRVLLGLGRAREAAAALAAALAHDARPAPEAFLDLAAALAAGGTQGDRAGALAVLDRGIRELGPAVALVDAAVALDLQAGAWDRALGRLEQVARHAQRQAFWLRRRAEVLLAAGRTAAAAAALEAAGEESDGGAGSARREAGAPAAATPQPSAAPCARAPSSPDLHAARDSATVVRGPYLQDATPTSMVVRWRTSLPTDTRLWLGATPGTLLSAYGDPTLTTEHVATASGLQPQTQYFYGVGSQAGIAAGGDAEHAFQTLPPPGAVRPLRLWALGDAGTANANQRAVRDAYGAFAAAHPADVILMLGDNAYSSGTDSQYQAAVFDMYPTFLRKTCLWSTLGNHDASSASSATQSGVYFDIFTLPRLGEAGGLPSGTEAYYSFDRGHVHLICLDSQDSDRTATGAMMQWLQADLASTAATWVIAFFHHPPYTKGSHDSDDPSDSSGRMQDMRQVALPILEAAGVDLVLSGHSHDYERSYLLDGHYGVSSTLQTSMLRDRGDGFPAGDGSYGKPTAGRAGHEGAVYVVAGSAGKTSSGPLDHPAMYIGLATLGSLVVDVDGNRLDGTFVAASGAVLDRFTIEKGLARTLFRDVPSLSVTSGGRQQFTLAAGPARAGGIYLLAGAFGTAPGFGLGAVHVPLNRDGWLEVSVDAANGPFYPGSCGVLDGSGRASAAFVLPPAIGSVLLGNSLYHAFAVLQNGAVVHASNAVRVRFTP